MSKSELLVTLATLSDGDARLDAVASALAGQSKSDPPASLKLYRMGEAARVTGLSRPTLWRCIKDGRIKAVEVRAGSSRISEAELQRFVKGGRLTHD